MGVLCCTEVGIGIRFSACTHVENTVYMSVCHNMFDTVWIFEKSQAWWIFLSNLNLVLQATKFRASTKSFCLNPFGSSCGRLIFKKVLSKIPSLTTQWHTIFGILNGGSGHRYTPSSSSWKASLPTMFFSSKEEGASQKRKLKWIVERAAWMPVPDGISLRREAYAPSYANASLLVSFIALLEQTTACRCFSEPLSGITSILHKLPLISRR